MERGIDRMGSMCSAEAHWRDLLFVECDPVIHPLAGEHAVIGRIGD